MIDRYLREETPKHRSSASEILRLKAFKRDEGKLCARGMATLKTEDFEGFRDRRLQNVKSATVTRDLDLLHCVVEYSRRRINLAENPINDVRRPKVQNERDIRFQGDEEARLMAALDDCRNKWVKPVVIFAIETAMRRAKF